MIKLTKIDIKKIAPLLFVIVFVIVGALIIISSFASPLNSRRFSTTPNSATFYNGCKLNIPGNSPIRGLQAASNSPALLITMDDVKRSRSLLASANANSDDVLVKMNRKVMADAKAALTIQPGSKGLSIGPPTINPDPSNPNSPKGLTLETARSFKERIFLFGYGYYMSDGTQKVEYLEAAKKDLTYITSKDSLKYSWVPEDRPTQLLNAGEMATTLSIGYDWFKKDLPDNLKKQIQSTIGIKFLPIACTWYNQPATSDTITNRFKNIANQPLVMNSSAIVSAIAYSDTDPASAAAILHNAQQTMIQYPLKAYAPDGGWEEGVTYWGYAHRYLTYALSSLKNSYNNMLGLNDPAGIAQTNNFIMNIVGPSNKAAIFGDSTPGVGTDGYHIRWWQDYDNNPGNKYANWIANRQNTGFGGPQPLDVFWYKQSASPNDDENNKIVNFVNYGAMARNSWTDANTGYFALHTGSNRDSHAHLDLGAFSYDAMGVNWTNQLGAPSYGIKGIWDDDTQEGRRFENYAISTQSSNTIGVLKDGKTENQNIFGEVPPAEISANPRVKFAKINLSDVILGNDEVRRGLALYKDDGLLIQDEINAQNNNTYRWTMNYSVKPHVDQNIPEPRPVCNVQGSTPNNCTFRSGIQAAKVNDNWYVLVRVEDWQIKEIIDIFLLSAKGSIKYIVDEQVALSGKKDISKLVVDVAVPANQKTKVRVFLKPRRAGIDYQLSDLPNDIDLTNWSTEDLCKGTKSCI